MSSNWRYIASTIVKNKGSIIKRIEYAEKLTSEPPIYKWVVVTNNNHIYNLYDNEIKNINGLTNEDKKALYEAFHNDLELTKKGYQKIKDTRFY
jgi:hypothetical protein